VDRNGRVKLSELGFVRADPRTVSVEGKTPRRGAEDLGTAPEILRGEEYSGKADIFSYGVVLYEIITAKEVPPRNMSTNFGFEMEEITKELNKVTECPGQLRMLTLQCLDSLPDARPEATTVGIIVKEILSSLTQSGKENPPVTPNAERARSGDGEDTGKASVAQPSGNSSSPVPGTTSGDNKPDILKRPENPKVNRLSDGKKTFLNHYSRAPFSRRVEIRWKKEKKRKRKARAAKMRTKAYQKNNRRW